MSKEAEPEPTASKFSLEALNTPFVVLCEPAVAARASERPFTNERPFNGSRPV